MLTFLLLLGSTASADAALVVDGDTIEIDGVRIRLHGVDAPEHGQTCSALGEIWRCGQAATEHMEALLSGADIACQPRGEDGYGRVIATCEADGADLGGLMVSAGLAWAYTRFSDDYLNEEAEARRNRLGVWRGPNDPAWVFRDRAWRVAEADAPDGCPIKGNISRNGRIYHPPWSPWYARTRINTAKGERWFCSEAEAVRAGWRAPRWR